MKKLIPLFTFAFCLHLLLSANAATELVIHGAADSSAPIVVEKMPADNLELPLKWTFNAPATGWTPRTVLRVPADADAAFAAFLDTDGNGSYTPGEPFGVSSMRATPAIELTDMSAITPRVNLWSGDVDTASDRAKICGASSFTQLPNRFEEVSAPAPKSRVRVVRYMVDGRPVYKLGVNAGVVLDSVFEQDEKTYLQEGEFLGNGSFDIDWNDLYDDVTSWWGTLIGGCDVKNVTYLVVFNWDAGEYASDSDTNTTVKALSTLVTRRFEKVRSVPTPVSAFAHSTTTNYNFSFRIDNEDKWASWFGTTYTAFKVKVLNGTNEVWNSGVQRLPPRDASGVYTFSTTNNEQLTAYDSLTWRVAVYNAKFCNDTLIGVWDNVLHAGDPFSPAQPIVNEPPPPPDDPSGFVEIPIFLGRYRRWTGDVRVVDPETQKLLHVVPFSSTRPDRIVARFHTADTNAAFAAYLDKDGSGSYTPGEPFGVSSMRATPAIELTDMSAVTPRVNLWSDKSDREVVVGREFCLDMTNNIITTKANSQKAHVKVVRYGVDGDQIRRRGVPATVVAEKDITKESRPYLSEGDFLQDGALDIDWNDLYREVTSWDGIVDGGDPVTNVTYLVFFNWTKSGYESVSEMNKPLTALGTQITRRFEKMRTIPTPVSAYFSTSQPSQLLNFSFRIDNEDKWASWFGTTYTAFKVKVLNGTNEVWNSGVQRLPPRDASGVYTFSTTNNEQLTAYDSLTWRVAVYNAKFSNDTLIGVWNNEIHTGDPFSPPEPITFIGE